MDMFEDGISLQIAIINKSRYDPDSPTDSHRPAQQSTVTVRIPLLNPELTVADVKAKVVQELHHFDGKQCDIRVIFAGKSLTDDSRIVDLDLGPATKVHAIVCAIGRQTSSSQASLASRASYSTASSSSLSDENAAPTSSFFVYCKSCMRLRAGKLRVRCLSCRSAAVQMAGAEGPSCWNDVLTPRRLAVVCLENECRDDAFADFHFKCTVCSQTDGRESIAVPLPQMRVNHPTADSGDAEHAGAQECCVCDETPPFGLVFACAEPPAHVACLECFVAYGRVCLDGRRFVLRPPFGYTLDCPVTGCGGAIEDPHHFRLLGDEYYDRYQSQATEMAILGERGLFCPRVNCSTGFLVDDDGVQQGLDLGASEKRNLQKIVVCPECHWSFCRECRLNAVDCCCATADDEDIADTTVAQDHQGQQSADDESPPAGDTADDLGGVRRSTSSASASTPGQQEQRRSMRTISITCKRCPVCGTATERSGGCAHMACKLCGADWCWLCVRRWTDRCQWEHWFDW